MKETIKARNKEMAEKYKNGATRRELAQEYRLAESSIQGCIHPYLDPDRKRCWGVGAKEKYRKRDEEIQTKFIGGKSITELSLLYGISERAVRNTLKKDPVTAEMTRKRMTPKQKEARDKEICEEYENGLTLEELSNKYGLAKSTIWRYVCSYSRREFIGERNEWMYEKYKAGESIEELAEEYGLAETTVGAIIRKKRGKTPENIELGVVYPNLEKWMIDNGYNKRKFYIELLKHNDDCVSECTLAGVLAGRTKPSFKTIKIILEHTKMSFAEAFYRNE